MHRFASTVVRLLITAAVLGGLGWGVLAAWQLRQARRAAAAVAAELSADFAAPAPGKSASSNLQAAAGSLQRGDFQAVCDLLAPRPLTAADQETVRRFFAAHSELRQRLVAAAASAEHSRDAEEATRVRRALAGALCAAADGNVSCAENCVALAQQASEIPLVGGRGVGGGSGPPAVAARVQAIEPAFSLARDLLTECYAPAQRLVARASRLYRQGQYEQAAAVLDLAGELLGAPPPALAASPAEVPQWFTAIAEAPPQAATPVQAKALVSFCEAVARSQTVSPAVRAMIRQAEHQADAERPAEARWWGSVALQSLGLPDKGADSEAEGER